MLKEALKYPPPIMAIRFFIVCTFYRTLRYPPKPFIYVVQKVGAQDDLLTKEALEKIASEA